MVLPVMIEGFIAALDEIDTIYLLTLKTENVSFIKKYFIIYLPLIMPYILMTCLQTFGLGIKVMIMGEYICQSNNSLGNIVYLYKQNLDFAHLFALLIEVVILVFIVEIAVKIVKKKLNYQIKIN